MDVKEVPPPEDKGGKVFWIMFLVGELISISLSNN